MQMNSHDYEDIIHLPHYEPRNHPRMPIYKRAAQFAPFAALTGYDQKVEEAGRYVEGRPEQSEDDIRMIEEKIQILMSVSGRMPEVSIYHFIEDERKEGGSCRWKKGTVKKADPYRKQIVMNDGTIILFQDILEMEGQISAEETGQLTI